MRTWCPCQCHASHCFFIILLFPLFDSIGSMHAFPFYNLFHFFFFALASLPPPLGYASVSKGAKLQLKPSLSRTKMLWVQRIFTEKLWPVCPRITRCTGYIHSIHWVSVVVREWPGAEECVTVNCARAGLISKMLSFKWPYDNKYNIPSFLSFPHPPTSSSSTSCGEWRMQLNYE